RATRAQPLPKNDVLMGTALEGLPQDKKIVLHCKTGVRSAEVLAVLKSAGFADAVHVGGGVIGWVNQIAPSKPPVSCSRGQPRPSRASRSTDPAARSAHRSSRSDRRGLRVPRVREAP